MKESNNSSFYQKAMYYGTLLGLIWSLMYFTIYKSIGNPALSYISLALCFSSPFIAGRYAARYRDNDMNGDMTYSQAWYFIFHIYIFASMLSTVFNIVYFEFIDNGTLFATFEAVFEELEKLPEMKDSPVEMYKEALNEASYQNLVWAILESNMLCSIILPTIIALFVRKTDRKI